MPSTVDYLKDKEIFFQYMHWLSEGGTHSLREYEVVRAERIYHVVGLLKSYSYHSENARTLHRRKYNINSAACARDFSIAYYIFGQLNILDQDSNRAWIILRLQRMIDQAEANSDYKAVAALSKEYKEIAQLHLKQDKEVPPADLPPISIAPHPQAIEYKRNPELLEQHLKIWKRPKKTIGQLQEAQIIKDEPSRSSL